MSATRPAVAILLAALVLSASAVAGAESSRQQASFTLTETRPARGAAERFAVDYIDPEDPAAKPRAVRTVTTILPRGARYDPSVPGSCTAPDAELIVLGAAACPPDSAIGGGVVTVDTGFPEPGRVITADVRFFNNAADPDGEFIYLNTVRGGGARTVIRADVSGRERVTAAGSLPGTPPDGGAIDTVDVTIADVSRVVDGQRRSYITTPQRCRGRRGDRHWTTRVTFAYGDGVVQTVKDRVPCRRKRGR